jgi:hypothetical protein
VIGCAFFMEGLDSTMIAVAIPDMAKGLGESPLRLNLVITTYLLSLAVFIPVSGWIADRLGTRVVFCVAIAIFAAGSALDDDPGNDRADCRPDRRRLPDNLSLVARDLLSQPADRDRRRGAGAMADRRFPRTGADAV